LKKNQGSMSMNLQGSEGDADTADQRAPNFIQDGVSLQYTSESMNQAFFFPEYEPAPMAAASLPFSYDRWANQTMEHSTYPLMPAAFVSVESQPPPTEAVKPSIATKYCRILYLDQDIENLSPYQCMVRKQINIFTATEDDLQDKSQGRNRPIILNQVGIRCLHCGTLPTKQRAKGAVFFPSQLDGLYQTAQNMANKHLLHDCCEIPTNVRQDLFGVRLKEKGLKTRKSAYGGGRHYWADGLRVLGVVQTTDRRLMRTITPAIPVKAN
jgi:hypothetical protein